MILNHVPPLLVKPHFGLRLRPSRQVVADRPMLSERRLPVVISSIYELR
jgi:hypothetical protein